MGNENQVKQEGGAGMGQTQTGYIYGKSNTRKKPSLKETSLSSNFLSSHKGAHLTPQNMMIQ